MLLTVLYILLASDTAAGFDGIFTGQAAAIIALVLAILAAVLTMRHQ